MVTQAPLPLRVVIGVPGPHHNNGTALAVVGHTPTFSELCDGTHVVVCPNRDNPGVRENVTKNIEKMGKNCKK